MNPTLFRAAGCDAIELNATDVPALQAFFEANPLYFESVNGEPARPTEAHEEFHDELPPGFIYTRKMLLGFFDESGRMQGMANVVSDLMARHVWHIGTFIVATARHGRGDAQALHAALELWIVAQGAQWLRLGVVEGNARAERFWQRCGYAETRKRPGLVMGQRTNTVRVMLKPLAGGTVDEYLALVPRDRPD
jgi:GNAT superfamily N-acetyltransferase